MVSFMKRLGLLESGKNPRGVEGCCGVGEGSVGARQAGFLPGTQAGLESLGIGIKMRVQLDRALGLKFP